MMLQFSVEGPLFGYRASRSSRKTETGRDVGGVYDQEYIAFKDRVLKLAMVAGWKGMAEVGRRGWRVELSVAVYWRDAARVDWSNCYKAVEDAIFRQDRYVRPGEHQAFEWDTGKPEHAIVRVVIREEGGRDSRRQGLLGQGGARDRA